MKCFNINIVLFRQETISKFRQLVKELQDSNEELKRAQNGSDDGENPEEKLPELKSATAVDYQIKMVETKVGCFIKLTHQIIYQSLVFFVFCFYDTFTKHLLS